MLKEYDTNAKCNVKSFQRSQEKARNDYRKDKSRILDYLRGTVHIRDFDQRRLQQFEDEKEQRTIERKKFCSQDETNLWPRIILNIRFTMQVVDRQIEQICEVQIPFTLPGVDDDYQECMHTVYELFRRKVTLINDDDRVKLLCVNLAANYGIEISEEIRNGWFVLNENFFYFVYAILLRSPTRNQQEKTTLHSRY